MNHQEFIDQYLNNLDHVDHYIKDDILYVDFSLNLYKSDITTLPKRLHICGNFYLYKSNITLLPEELTVEDDLDLQNTNITSLPEGLSVGGILYHDNKLTMTENAQLSLISQNNEYFDVIKAPTKKAKTLQKLLWEI